MRLLWEIVNVAPLGNCGLKILKSPQHPEIFSLENIPEQGPGTSASEDQGRVRPQEHKAVKSKKKRLQNHKINNQLGPITMS